jgi:hypothetical protein
MVHLPLFYLALCQAGPATSKFSPRKMHGFRQPAMMWGAKPVARHVNDKAKPTLALKNYSGKRFRERSVTIAKKAFQNKDTFAKRRFWPGSSLTRACAASFPDAPSHFSGERRNAAMKKKARRHWLRPAGCGSSHLDEDSVARPARHAR